MRIAADGPFQIGLTEVKLGMTLPWFAVELARYRLSAEHLDAAAVCARMYSPSEAVAAGFVDRVVPARRARRGDERRARQELAALNMEAHAATKQRIRGDALAPRSARASSASYRRRPT